MEPKLNKAYVITFFKVLEESSISKARAYADRMISEGYADGVDAIIENPVEVKDNNNT